MKKFYKVVRRVGETRISAYVERNVCQYQVNEWTYPTVKGTGLFVFDNKEMAQRYARTESGSEVWEVEIQGKPIHLWINYFVTEDYLREMFRRPETSNLSSNDYHNYSYACDAVKLIKEVE